MNAKVDPRTTPHVFDLDERYDTISGRVLMTGIQALVRALNDQALLDEWREINSGGFVSGYRGSPLGGLDKELWRVEARLGERNIRFQPGVNEDLAATAVWGTQQVGLHAGNTVTGVYGMWYGKAPGLDRSCDAIRHANAWGTSASGGVLCVVGDDPAAKSSSLATQSEFTLQDMMLPILVPADIQEVRDFALIGWQMSRVAGCWVGLKAIADHMDAASIVDVSLDRFKGFEGVAPGTAHIRIEDTPQEQERRLLGVKVPNVIQFSRVAGLNEQVTKGKDGGRLGIICAGKAYADVRESLALTGLHTVDQISEAGIELLKLGMTWPMDADLINNFARGVERVVVIEEKRSFVEAQVREVLYGRHQVPVAGKMDFDGKPLIPQTGILEPSAIARWLAAELELSGPEVQTNLLVTEVDAPARKERTPLFCAGCPHNRSTRVPEGSRATAGIGCHYMVQWMDRDTDSCTHMGGEGVTWVGESLFTTERHIFANLGDGTYFHSGLLAIRQAQAANVNITYKILFNEAVAMTGGQSTDGELTVAGVVDQVRAEGVSHVVVVSANPEVHSNLDVPVYARDELDDVQEEMRQVEGVSVLIYQQTCATELRRQRKRGLVEDKTTRLFINEDACEGCGDCAVVSNCVAVEPVPTQWGTKRRINQTLCNKDDSCAEGFCPAIVKVEVPAGVRSAEKEPTELLKMAAGLPEPEAPSNSNLLVTGVGGTGIVTVSALLAAAAKVDGRSVKTLDMTGLAQKGGAVFAHIRIGARIGERIGAKTEASSDRFFTPRIPFGRADALIACDVVAAASNEAMSLLSRGTKAIVNSHVLPTAETWQPNNGLSSSKVETFNPHQARLKRIGGAVGELSSFNAEDFAKQMFGSALQANIVLLGVSFQAGLIPLSSGAITAAIEANGVQVKRNLMAFQLGRLLQTNPRILDLRETSVEVSLTVEQARERLTTYRASEDTQDFDRTINTVRRLEQGIRPGSDQLTRTIAREYVRALAPKDEFEIGRLLSSDKFAREIEEHFGKGAKASYLMAPPLLGDKKRTFGPWMKRLLTILGSAQFLRGTWLDVFRFSSEARLSKAALDLYENWIHCILRHTHAGNFAVALELAALFSEVRGFGHVKSKHLERAREKGETLKTKLLQAPVSDAYDTVNHF